MHLVIRHSWGYANLRYQLLLCGFDHEMMNYFNVIGVPLILSTAMSEPRGLGFVQYMDPEDAVEAKYQVDVQTFHGRQLTVVFAEENRKEHRSVSPVGRRSRERSYSHSLDRDQSPGYDDGSRSHSQTHHSPPYSRSRNRSPGRRVRSIL